MCKESMELRDRCCDQGPQGVAGLQGPQGVQGQIGPQGIAGLQGIQGSQGLQGIPGKDCDDHGHFDRCDRFANLYASKSLVVGPYASATDVVLFDSQNAISVADFDISLAGSSGDIKFLKHGIYFLSWELQGAITPPVPVPVPSWSFGFWLNGVLVNGSIYSGFTQAPGDDACHSTGQVQIEVKSGDVLKLRNTSISSVNLNPNINGSVFPITIASVNISCLKALA